MDLEFVRVFLTGFSALVCWVFVVVYWTEPWRVYNRRAGWSLWGSGVTLGIIQTSLLFLLLGLSSPYCRQVVFSLTSILVILVIGQRLIWTLQVKEKRRREKV